ncbi:hypothetical protein SAMN05216371_7774 [Streptomyces sp. TLI_053]|uniref:helix-turn-helix transcriptional regulator n=1 Tax=Streptomyces sp. TLI_053 TaxID=1855352 RepID=UPI00087C2094|nr:helix-turn-helix transcriptional regulator [Streptomyces sp. TLI_053]SDT82962.1 hypothetical protein SAMN05216371_7774 [Streptomyces sp. TLI_053]
MPHPLAQLRTALGLAQHEYADLVARTHHDLGLGRTAARREKVSRWESGRIVPEFTAQLAIAHIHGVPAREIHLRDWPHWLRLAAGTGAVLDRRTVYGGGPPGHRTDTPEPAVRFLTGPALHARLRAALTAASECRSETAVEYDTDDEDERLAWIEARTSALEQQLNGTLIPATHLYATARAEHRLALHLHRRAPSPSTSILVARTALICGRLGHALCAEAAAERYALTAIRAAAAAQDTTLLAGALEQLGARHTHLGDPEEALLIVSAGHNAARDCPPPTAAFLHCVGAMALARQGRAVEAVRSLDLATSVLADAYHRVSPGDRLDPVVGRRALTAAHGKTWLYLGRPARAAQYFDALAQPTEAAPEKGPLPTIGRWLLPGVTAQLALGALDQAAQMVHFTVDVMGDMGPDLSLRYRRLLAPHRREPLIGAALDHLRDTGPT